MKKIYHFLVTSYKLNYPVSLRETPLQNLKGIYYHQIISSSHHLIIFLLSAFCIFSAGAQNDWLCIYPDKKVYFEDNQQLVYCLRVDSTSIDNSVLYPFSDLHQIGWDCYSITSGSWLSKYIVINDDGNTIFVNGKNQHILIKSQADLDEIWNVFENENIKVKGKINSISLETVLGVEDSVKTISFSVYDKNDEPINHILTQFTIMISKHLGLVKTVNFYYFEHEINHLGEYTLIGISEPQLGFQNINLKEQYYDFQVGDEFHIYHAYTPGIEGPYNEYKTIHRYLSRTDFEDKIEYYYERKINSNIPKDTVKQIITKGLLFNTEPNEPYGDDYIGKALITNTPLPKLFFEDYDIYSYSIFNDSCLYTFAVDECRTPPTYFPGLGGPYYSCCTFWFVRYCYELIYYKKGDTEWGTPYNLPVFEYKNHNVFSVFPNPTTGELRIENGELRIENVEIYDVYGRKLYLSTHPLVHSSTVNIDISHLQNGVYFVKIYTEAGVVTKKVIKN